MNSTDTSLGAESRSQEIATNQKRNSPDLPLDSAVEKPESGRIEPPKPNSARSPAPSAKHEKPTDEASSKEEDKPETAESGYIQAEPVQGYAELYEYFNANLVYPVEALKYSIQGVHTISFVINTQGMPEQIEIVKSLGPSFEKECKRLIENMPAWKPARLNGKPVPSKISLPLTFQIQKIKN